MDRESVTTFICTYVMSETLIFLIAVKEITVISVTTGVGLLFLALCLAFTCHKTCSRKRKRTRTYGRIRVRELAARPEEVPMMSSNSIGSDLDD